jgi:hypothetical protein
VRRPGRTDRLRKAAGPLLLVAALLLPLVACTTQASSPGAAVDLVRSSVGAIPADDEQAIRTTIDRLNGTAGGSVAGQQAALAATVEPGSVTELDDCPAATATLRFLPVYSALRPSPDWTPDKGSLSGTIYALPTLIRIYT